MNFLWLEPWSYCKNACMCKWNVEVGHPCYTQAFSISCLPPPTFFQKIGVCVLIWTITVKSFGYKISIQRICCQMQCDDYENTYLNLTLMMLVDNFANTKWCKKPKRWKKPWHMGTHLRVLIESFPKNTNMIYRVKMVFQNLCVLVLWTKVASALIGLSCSVSRNEKQAIQCIVHYGTCRFYYISI